jgi:murein DD-endopeptidase MepM/ murein hydrolase activator NlpD
MIRKPDKANNKFLRIVLSALFILAIVCGYFVFRWFSRNGGRSGQVMTWIRDPSSHPEWALIGSQRCNDAPFIIPTTGFFGFLWDDTFRPGHHHQGIDIFGGEEPGITPVFAAYSGYLTRLPDWKSSVIIRIPSDPLHPSRQIWTYYTHMANKGGESYILPDFPMGTTELLIEEGTLLGYQGNYSGDPNNPTGIHLHFSIVKNDADGGFLNELKIQNTIDPSPYLGMSLNARMNPGEIPKCEVPDE